MSDNLIQYKDGWQTYFIDPTIKTQLMVLDLKYQKLNEQYIKLRNKKTVMEKKLNDEVILKLKPITDKIRDITVKKNKLSMEKRNIIEASCTHKTKTRWSGDHYNEVLVKYCILCGKDFGEVQ